MVAAVRSSRYYDLPCSKPTMNVCFRSCLVHFLSVRHASVHSCHRLRFQVFELQIGTVNAAISHAAATASCTVRVFQFARRKADGVPGSFAAATVARTTVPAELAVDSVGLPAGLGVSIRHSIVLADQCFGGLLSF